MTIFKKKSQPLHLELRFTLLSFDHFRIKPHSFKNDYVTHFEEKYDRHTNRHRLSNKLPSPYA